MDAAHIYSCMTMRLIEMCGLPIECGNGNEIRCWHNGILLL